MKILGILALIVCGVLSGVCQETAIESKDFDVLFKTSHNIYQIWKGVAFRRSVSIEARAPGHIYRLKQIFEFDSNRRTRNLYDEAVEGKIPRLTREVITIDDNSYIRDLGKSSRWVSYRRGSSEFSLYGAYASSSSRDAHAIHDYFVRDRFRITGHEAGIKFLGSEKLEGMNARVFSKTEIVKGVRTSDGSPFESHVVMKFWFSDEGIVLKSDTESKGQVGAEEYYRRITSVWQRDPSIHIEIPFSVPKTTRKQRST